MEDLLAPSLNLGLGKSAVISAVTLPLVPAGHAFWSGKVCSRSRFASLLTEQSEPESRPLSADPSLAPVQNLQPAACTFLVVSSCSSRNAATHLGLLAAGGAEALEQPRAGQHGHGPTLQPGRPRSGRCGSSDRHASTPSPCRHALGACCIILALHLRQLSADSKLKLTPADCACTEHSKAGKEPGQPARYVQTSPGTEPTSSKAVCSGEKPCVGRTVHSPACSESPASRSSVCKLHCPSHGAHQFA